MTLLVMIGLGGISLLLFLMLKFKVQPFLALLLTSIAVALAAGLPVAKLAATVEEGLGGALGHIALIIALGAMIGRMIEESGGAGALATAMIDRFGDRRVALALVAVAFLVGIPVFFEVGVIMLMPLAYGVARRTGGGLVALAVPMCATLLVVHSLLPPHPGAVATAGLLHADFGRILMFGLPLAAMVALAIRPLGRWLVRGNYPITDDVAAQLAEVRESSVPAEGERLPPVSTIIALIALPILMIMGGTLATLVLPAASEARPIFAFLGIPFVALLADVLLCAFVLGTRRGWPREKVAHVLGAAIPAVSIVIMITGGGAIFAKVLVTTGIGAAVASLLQSTGLPLLFLAFLLTLLIRAAQGPTTVALITTAGIIGPFVAGHGFDPNRLALLCLAMGCGGMAASHVNDPGFWIVTRLAGLNVRDGLKTWTPLTTLAGLLGFALVALLWLGI